MNIEIDYERLIESRMGLLKTEQQKWLPIPGSENTPGFEFNSVLRSRLLFFRDALAENPDFMRDPEQYRMVMGKLAAAELDELLPVMSPSQIMFVDTWVTRVQQNPTSCAVYEKAARQTRIYDELGVLGYNMYLHLLNYNHTGHNDMSAHNNSLSKKGNHE